MRYIKHLLSGAALICGLCATPQSADADVTLKMKKWGVLPRVVIAEAMSGDCQNLKIIYDGSLVTGYREAFPGTGSNGPDLCFRRTVDPKKSSSPLTITWSRCAADGDCEIQ